MVAVAPSDTDVVPSLRGELSVSFQGQAGARKALIYDPVSHRYYELSKQSTMILQNWSLGTKDAILSATQRLGHAVSESAIETLSQFLILNGLVKHPGAAQGYSLWHMQKAQLNTFRARFSALLFFRVRLGNPDPLISGLYDVAWPLLTRSFRWLTFITFLCAAWLLSSMPSVVSEHLVALVSLQGAPELLIALALVKLCHELGHGLQAKRLGLRVPTGGIMFLLGLPLPFVELSSAWQLERAKDRLRVDAGGILAELAVAAWCLLAFAFWPDGTMRSILFAMATSSLALTLFVNLNPLMRFDGYFMLSDAIGIKNLQSRAIAVMLWRLREVLFNLKDDCPENWSPRTRRRLILYGIALALYRVTLYMGIALMAYAILNKALGIAVFVFQMIFFIGLPVLKETQVWWKRRTDIIKQRRIWMSLACLAILLALLFTPFQQRFTVPARLSNADAFDYVAPRSALLERSAKKIQESATANDLLWQFVDPDLDAAITSLTSKLDAIEGRIERIAASAQTRAQAPIFQKEKARLQAELETQVQKRNRLALLAQSDGVVVSHSLRVPMAGFDAIALAPNAPLGTLVTPRAATVKALIPARARSYIPDDATADFRSGFESIRPNVARKIQLGPLQIGSSPVAQLSLPEAAAQFGGAIITDPQNPERPRDNWFPATASVSKDLALNDLMSIPGQLVIQGRERSYAERIWSRVTFVLVQQIGN